MLETLHHEPLEPSLSQSRTGRLILARLGYTLRAPVAIEEFANPAQRTSWRPEKAMTVFSLFSATYPGTEIDIFIEDPPGFDQAIINAMIF